MPPSGFDNESVAPLLELIKDYYQQTEHARGDANEVAFLQKCRDRLLRVASGESGAIPISENGHRALAKFFAEITQDVLDEIGIGKKTAGHAVEKEISDIERFLLQFTIEEVAQ